MKISPSHAYARICALSTLLPERDDRERCREAARLLVDAALCVSESEAA